MSFKQTGLTRTLDHQSVSKKDYDVVIVGSGISGSIVAKELSAKGHSVLILEAGTGKDLTLAGYDNYLDNFYKAAEKDNNAPFLPNANAPMPRGPQVKSLRPGQPNTQNYLVQNGPLVTDTTYSRVVGGTTMHFESKTPRMLPEDFAMNTNYGQGVDWPISYEELQPYYEKAEFEMGVSGEVSEQNITGEDNYGQDYVFPMHKMPASYLDKSVAKHIDGMEVDMDGELHKLQVRSFPQGRNGVPNKAYKKVNDGKDFVPVGAVSIHQAESGERCQGNNNCTPICPVQAKYDARKTLAQALKTKQDGDFMVDLLSQAVASKVNYDKGSGRITSITYKHYKSVDSPEYETGEVKGKIFVLAANAIETARLLLASNVPNTSGLIGRNLMDHPYLLTWGLLPEIAGTTRGTICTSGISDIRYGKFRSKHAAFAIDIHNDGWGWATGSPNTNLIDIVDNQNKFGKGLRRQLISEISRQLLMAVMVELLPDPSNRITVNPAYQDRLGNMRPVISFNVPDYTLEGVAFARQLTKRIFQRCGAEEHTSYDPLDFGYVTHNGEGYALRGGNHISGTHIMGTHQSNSVVDSMQKSWDHSNLYLTGAGSMASIGTANTTVTLAALCYRSIKSMEKDLKK